MTNLFDGVEKFGLEGLQGLDMFKADKPVNDKGKTIKKEFEITDYIYDKSYVCPVCDKTFKSPTVKIGKLKPVSIDYDLRPIYQEQVQPLFYDIVICIHCGYSAISQKFKSILEKQADAVREIITPKFIPVEYPALLTVDMAIEQYKLALLNAIVKTAKDGEKAYICMKLAWLYRLKEDHNLEMEFIDKAYTGFSSAYINEVAPICGLDEPTVIYLLAAFSKALGKYEESLRMLAKLIISRGVLPRLKERARELKDGIRLEQGKMKKSAQ